MIKKLGYLAVIKENDIYLNLVLDYHSFYALIEAVKILNNPPSGTKEFLNDAAINLIDKFIEDFYNHLPDHLK